MGRTVGTLIKNCPFDGGPSNTGLKSFILHQHRNYAESKLILSGDIETQPGPKLLLIFLLIVIINKINKEQETLLNPQPPSNIYTQTDEINSIANLLTIRRGIINNRGPVVIQSTSSLFAILLILAGDVHPKPGPKQEGICSKCKLEDSDETSVTCDTCREWCHLQCSEKPPDVNPIFQRSFEWICPNVNCNPNYHPGKKLEGNHSTNRYCILQKEVNQNGSKKKTKKPSETFKNKVSPKILQNKSNNVENLWNELPKISAKDYQGKELCKACSKAINKQRAISCDACHQWTHQKCSDMSVKVYNKHRNKVFSWVCNTCREPECMESITDIRKLQPEEMPTPNEDIAVDDSELLILHYNCRSLINKRDDLENICSKLNPAVICLTETWLDDSTPPTAYIPEGYKILRKDRSDEFKQRYGKTSGGGTAILFKKDMKVGNLNIGEDDQETQWIQIRTAQNFILGLVYRAHYTDLLYETDDAPQLEMLLNEASIKTNKVIIMGDFNCDVSAQNKDYQTNTLEQLFGRMSMKQLITRPTRISTSNNTTIIDHVWTNPTLKLVNESGTIEGISDHAGQYIKVNQKKEKPEPEKIRFRNYRCYNQERFNEDLKLNIENSEFNNQIDEKKLNNAMDTWLKVFTDTAHKHAPMIEKIKKYKRECIPWYTKDLEIKIKERSSKLQLYRLYGDKKDLKAANNITNVITHLKRKLKKKHYKEKIEKYEGDPRNLWKVLKDITQTTPDKSAVEPEFMDKNKANQFNKFFATIGTEIQKYLGFKETASTSLEPGVFRFQADTQEVIIGLIDRIRTDVATGEDNISAKLLKDTKFTIAESITKLVNLSYSLKTFPDSMKKAIIRPIYKKNCIEDMSNYRPISILSVVSKIFERSATNKLVKYLEDNHLLNGTQHAYRKGHSTQTCLMEVVEYIYKQRDQGKIVGIASLDLSKAFDSINHAHLLEKLGKLGVSADAVHWCKSYLEDRTQKTKFKNHVSEESKVTSGVPQGSILGPILFICFTNDMASIFTNCKVLSYADDTQLIVTGSNKKQVKAQIEELIKTAQTWYTKNSLKNNTSKTEIIIIGKNMADKKMPTFIEVIDEGKVSRLEPSKYIKILGMYIDDQLNWNQQTQKVRKKANNSIRNLHRINQLIPLKHRILLYNSLVASHYNYSDTVWSGCGVINEKKLQTTQNFAARSILGKSKHSSATEALKTLNFLPLKEKRKIHEAVYVHKALNEKLPKEIVQQYKSCEPIKHLRSSKFHTLNIPKHNTEHYKRGPLYRTLKTWNSVPEKLRSDITTTTFKKNYQSYLIKQYSEH